MATGIEIYFVLTAKDMDAFHGLPTFKNVKGKPAYTDPFLDVTKIVSYLAQFHIASMIIPWETFKKDPSYRSQLPPILQQGIGEFSSFPDCIVLNGTKLVEVYKLSLDLHNTWQLNDAFIFHLASKYGKRSV